MIRHSRTSWLGFLAERTARDVRVGVRRLTAHPGFALPVILALGIGLGAAAAIFALANAVILRPLPYPTPDRLVAIGHLAPDATLGGGGMSEAELAYYQSQSRTLSSIAGFYSRELSLTGGEVPERVAAALVTPGFFSVLGVAAERGRGCLASDLVGWDVRSGTRVVVISHELWQRRFGSDPSVVGRTVDEVNRQKMMIAGVMPPGFHFPNVETSMWYCWPIDTINPGLNDRAMTGIARMRPGATLSGVAAELRTFDARLAARFGTTAGANPSAPPSTVRPLEGLVVRDVQSALALLLSAGALLLLVAWANVANLFITRAEQRQQLAAVERALGAGEPDILRRSIVEGVLVAGVGGLLALGIASTAITLRFGFQPGQIPRLYEVRIDGLLIALIAALSLASGVALGVVSYVRTRHARAARSLSATIASARTTTSREWRLTSGMLVSVQLAVALALLVGSVAMLESYVHLSRASLGFDPTNTLIVDLSLPASPYPRYADGARFYADVADRLRRMPGVRSVEVAGGSLPLAPLQTSEFWTIAPSDASGPRQSRAVAVAGVTPNWAPALHIPIVRGRTFRAGDLEGDVPVILNQSLARSLYGDADPIGRRVKVGQGRYEQPIIGVIGDVPGASVADGPMPTVYFPILDDLRSTPDVKPATPLYAVENSIFIRTDGVAPMSLLSTVKRVVRELDPRVPVARPRLFSEVVSASTARARLTMALLFIAAAAALSLGVVGVYGLTAYVVGTRTREFGIRMALGATERGIRALVVSQHIGATVAGVIAGLGAALMLTRLLRGLLYQVAAVDPLIFSASAVGVLLLGLLGSWLPARRAGGVDIARTLRTE